MDMFTRDRKMKQSYLEGKSRQETMKELGITNTNSMSSASSRLRLHWSWPLEHRKSGIKPLSAQTVGPRKPEQTGGGTVHSIRARQESRIGPDIEVPADAPLYQAGSAPKRYGESPSVLTRQRQERGYQDADYNIGGERSPWPAPSKKLPFNDIVFLIRHLYEGVPLRP